MRTSPADLLRSKSPARAPLVAVAAVLALLVATPASAQIFPIDYGHHWEPATDIDAQVPFSGPDHYVDGDAADLPFDETLTGNGLTAHVEADVQPFSGTQSAPSFDDVTIFGGGLRTTWSTDPTPPTGVDLRSTFTMTTEQLISATGGASGSFLLATDLSWDGTLSLGSPGATDFVTLGMSVVLVDPRTSAVTFLLESVCEASPISLATGFRCDAFPGFDFLDVQEQVGVNAFTFDLVVSRSFTLPDSQPYLLRSSFFANTGFETVPNVVLDIDSTQTFQQSLTLLTANADLLVTTVPEPAGLALLALVAGARRVRRRPRRGLPGSAQRA